MGMSVTDEQGLFCVEMDAASPTSTYQNYIKYADREGTVLQNLEGFDLVGTLYQPNSYNDRFGIVNAFNHLDEMLSMRRTGVFENFMLPQRDLFGFCDNFKSASFLRSVDAETEGSCVQ